MEISFEKLPPNLRQFAELIEKNVESLAISGLFDELKEIGMHFTDDILRARGVARVDEQPSYGGFNES